MWLAASQDLEPADPQDGPKPAAASKPAAPAQPAAPAKAAEPEPDSEEQRERKAKLQRKEEALKEKEQGNAAYKAKKFDEAVSHYDKACELYDEDISFLTNRWALCHAVACSAAMPCLCAKAESKHQKHDAV